MHPQDARQRTPILKLLCSKLCLLFKEKEGKKEKVTGVAPFEHDERAVEVQVVPAPPKPFGEQSSPAPILGAVASAAEQALAPMIVRRTRRQTENKFVKELTRCLSSC